MAHIQTIDPATPSPSQELLAAVKANLGLIPNMTKVMANSPAVLKSYLDFSGDLSNGSLNPQVREQIALVVSQSNQCGYCVAAHAAIGKMVGLTDDQIADSRDSRGTDPRTTAALHFATEVLAGKGHVQSSALEAVRSAGFSDGEIAEIIANVALNVFTNYFNSVTEPEIDFPQVSLHKV